MIQLSVRQLFPLLSESYPPIISIGSVSVRGIWTCDVAQKIQSAHLLLNKGSLALKHHIRMRPLHCTSFLTSTSLADVAPCPFPTAEAFAAIPAVASCWQCASCSPESDGHGCEVSGCGTWFSFSAAWRASKQCEKQLFKVVAE